MFWTITLGGVPCVVPAAQVFSHATCIGMMDRWRLSTDTKQVEGFMLAYDLFYGPDSAPYWASYCGAACDVDDGVEQTQHMMGH